MKTRAQRRHEREHKKKKRHPSADCGNARCPVCSPYKARWWGNSLQAIKKKYWPSNEDN